jgi:hypothetical protein
MTQTCSLVCYKKHQQRAACSGKRDPAAYLKKKDLSTPTGLDQDFNYLKSIERRIDSAQGVAGTTSNDHGKPRGLATAWRGDGKLQAYLTENRITVERAPMGMQRQRDNTLRSTKGHRALWTVEWITDAGDREVQHDCSEASTIRDLFSVSRLGKSRKARRHVSLEDSTVKQRPAKKLKIEAEPIPVKDEASESVESTTGHADAGPTNATGRAEPQNAQWSNPNQPSSWYYLRRPSAASASKVLIPLDVEATLTQSLHNQVVQEYPTIYVMPFDADHLPDGYISFELYIARRKTEETKLEALQSVTATALRDEPHAPLPEAQKLDANSILEMLKRNVTAQER